MSDACGRPGCPGSYGPDGYCDECGYKRPAGPPVTASRSAVATASVTIPRSRAATGTVPRTSGRGGLGANLVHLPPVPLRDPSTAVMANPAVPEAQRYCPVCGGPVGRGRDGKPGRTEGFCPKDRTPFSFVPHLSLGDLVDDRYEILGALAHGGLGWIYLARDRTMSETGVDRWVVLKGLINTADPDAMAAAVAERRFLVEVDHPSIVKVYDFATHPDPATGRPVSYIVMEYVGGSSLKDLLLRHQAPLPLDQVLAYGIEILPALGYLHGRGLLFCDFKPDNVIHAEEQLKLIDLGAVRRVDDQDSPLWGTPGYQAPELETRGASVASDIYTVGRALAVLSFDFRGFSSTYAARLPDDVPLLAGEESYRRLLQRATATDPDQRFTSAAEFADQALGVLREVLANGDGAPRPTTSAHFTPPRRVFGADAAAPADTAPADAAPTGAVVAAGLPVPLVDPTDPGAGLLATLGGGDPAGAVATLRSSDVDSVEVALALVRALVDAGDPAAAADALRDAPGLDGDWRRDWYAGLIALAADRPGDAVSKFDNVYAALPGELAAQLALAAADELAGHRDDAIRRYLRVWRTDHGMVSAAFGLARTLLQAGDRAAAVAILDEVPEASRHHTAAQVAAVRASLDTRSGPLAEADLLAASQRLERLRLDTARQAGLAVEMLRQALAWLTSPQVAPSTPDDGLPPRRSWRDVVQEFLGRAPATPDQPARFLGEALREADLRLGLERAYRVLASLETDEAARYALVDLANAVRPQTVL